MAAQYNPRVALADVPSNVNGPAQVLAAGTIPNDQRVSRNSMFAQRLKRFMSVVKQFQNCYGSPGPGVPAVSDEEMAQAVTNEFRVVQAAANNNGGIENQLHEIKEGMNLLNAKYDNERRFTFNKAAEKLAEPLRAIAVTLPGGAQRVGDVPDLMSAGGIFPSTVEELLTLTPAQIATLRTYFNSDFSIQAGDSIENQRHKFGEFIGR